MRDNITVKESADMLCVSTYAIYNYVYAGRLEKAGRGHISRASVERLKAELELKRAGNPVPKPKETAPVAVTPPDPDVPHCDDCGIIIDCPAPNSAAGGRICLHCHNMRKRVRQSLDDS